MPDTIFYEIKLKRTKTPMEVFEKMQRSVRKKGPTKNWVCTVDRENECMVIDFGDGESENFTLAFENKVCNDFCKVYFPLEGELFEYEKGWDPKSTQVLRLYRSKFLPLFEREENEFEKCVLAYRFFVSIYDYLGFRYVGRE